MQVQQVKLTKEGIDEAVPHAAYRSNEPAALSAGNKAEWGSYDAHHQVTHRNVHQQQVNWRSQHFVLTKNYQNQNVVEESQAPDDSKADGCNQVANGAQTVLLSMLVVAAAAAQNAVNPTARWADARHSHVSEAVSSLLQLLG